jgi:hypothetical protein
MKYENYLNMISDFIFNEWNKTLIYSIFSFKYKFIIRLELSFFSWDYFTTILM